MPTTTRTPVKSPTTSPTVEPIRRAYPSRVCPSQRNNGVREGDPLIPV